MRKVNVLSEWTGAAPTRIGLNQTSATPEKRDYRNVARSQSGAESHILISGLHSTHVHSFRCMARFRAKLISPTRWCRVPNSRTNSRIVSRGKPSVPKTCSRTAAVTRWRSALQERRTCGSKTFSVPTSYVVRAQIVSSWASRARTAVRSARERDSVFIMTSHGDYTHSSDEPSPEKRGLIGIWHGPL